MVHKTFYIEKLAPVFIVLRPTRMMVVSLFRGGPLCTRTPEYRRPTVAKFQKFGVYVRTESQKFFMICPDHIPRFSKFSSGWRKWLPKVPNLSGCKQEASEIADYVRITRQRCIVNIIMYI